MKKYWIGALLLATTPAWAMLPWGATPAEQAMCQAKVYSRLDRSDPNSGHMHHYCDGLRFLNRAYSAMSNKQHMQFYMKESIDGFDYVLKHTQESYAMRGEVHVGKARALKLMGRKAEAAAEFNKALRYALDTPDIYQALADHYNQAGNKQQAMKMVTEGLQRNPNSKGLKRRYTEFGGKLPYPEAVDKAMPAEEAKTEVKPAVKPEAAPPSAEATNQATDGANLTAPTEPTSQIDPPKIGSPKNPYCRFCPD